MIANFFKYILGIFLAVSILIGGGVATALYLMNRTSVNPPKPVFSNDKPEVRGQQPNSKQAGKPSSAPVSKTQASPKPTPPTESPEADAPKELPPGAYQARVTWRQGLSLRKEPTQNAERGGGVGFNQKVIVLEESQDKVWQKIRLVDGEQEGWVKARNTEKVDDSQLTDEKEQTDETEQQQ